MHLYCLLYLPVQLSLLVLFISLHVFKLRNGVLSFQNKVLLNSVSYSSSTLAWKIPWLEEPGRLQSMGSLRVRHN